MSSLKKEAVWGILGLKSDIPLSSEEMAREMKATFFPVPENTNPELVKFAEELKTALTDLGVKILPYDEALIDLGLAKKIKLIIKIFFFNIKIALAKMGLSSGDENIDGLDLPFFIKLGKKIEKGVAVFAVGEGTVGNLPMDYTISFKENPIITILDWPKGIGKGSEYGEHTEAALKMFSWNLTNLAVSVNPDNWMVYSLNGSYPSYSRKGDFKNDVLNSLLPKISAPVRPPRLEEFEVRSNEFDVDDSFYSACINDLVEGGKMLKETGLYPEKRSIRDFSFRNNFYKWVVSVHLDKRSGMSYGFVAKQLPTKLSALLSEKEAEEKFVGFDFKDKDFFEFNGKNFFSFNLSGDKYYLEVPEVWVLASRSGSDKSKLDKKKDIVKMGLVNGKMVIASPRGVDMKGDYKPSFDTRVILAHAVGNAIIASVLAKIKPEWQYYKILENDGMALVHWHGYINPENLFDGWVVYGQENPPVSCSSLQTAVYAFSSKWQAVFDLINNNKEYKGDIHIEPHHGVNVTYSSITGLAEYLLAHPKASKLGEDYLNEYKSKL